MYDNLKSLGITNPDEIDRYSLRKEAKAYHHREGASVRTGHSDRRYSKRPWFQPAR